MPSSQSLQPLSKVSGFKTANSLETESKKSAITNVVLVAPTNAKRVKMELQSLGWLDKRFRMIKLSPNNIALPIKQDAWQSLKAADLQTAETTSPQEKTWHSLILNQEEKHEDMPFSTSQFAAKGKR